jgi:hypothetical protein
MDNVQHKAPKWAIELWKIYKYFYKDDRTENAYGVFHAGRCALEAQFNCSFGESTGFFHSDIEPIESSDGSFGIIEPPKPKWTHAVFNVEDYSHNYLTPGKLYLIKDWGFSSQGFTIVDDKGHGRYCLTKDCAHLEGGSWTLVSM